MSQQRSADGEKHSDTQQREIRRDELGTEIAQARLEVIAPLLDTSLDRTERAELVSRQAACGWIHPRHGRQSISERTVRRWLDKFRSDGFEGLRPRYRRDRGELRAIDPPILAEAKVLKREMPTRSVRRVIELLEARELVEPGELKRSTLARHLNAAGLTGRVPADKPPAVRRFQAAAPGDVWQSDEKFGPYLVGDEGNRRVRIFAFLDDHSRLCTGIEAYLEGTEVNLERTFRRALETYRKPTLVYVDNGAPFAATQFRRICTELDIALAHTAPYRAESKGKIERFWYTLDSFIAEANAARYSSLAELNDALWAWVELRYNQREHSALASSQTPFEVYSEHLEQIPAIDPQTLDCAFRHLVRRTVHKDGTVSIDGVIYQLPRVFRGQRVELRINPQDPTDVAVYRGTKRLAAAQLFEPPAKLAASSSDESNNPPQDRPLASSREYLNTVRNQHRESINASSSSPDIARTNVLDLSTILEVLDIADAQLTPSDRRAIEGVFDTFGPFERAPAIEALESAAKRLGSGRHITVYLNAMIKAMLGEIDT